MTPQSQVLEVYKEAVCNYVNIMLCYVVQCKGVGILGTGNTHAEAWTNALQTINSKTPPKEGGKEYGNDKI